MERLPKIVLGMALMAWGVTASAPVFGADRVEQRIVHKFIRGTSNAATGWVELPKHIYLRTVEGPLGLGTVQGIFEGVGMTFARTTAGLYEMATFPIPLPPHYGPLFRPEYVWQDEREGED